jgi:hypothetical protein
VWLLGEARCQLLDTGSDTHFYFSGTLGDTAILKLLSWDFFFFIKKKITEDLRGFCLMVLPINSFHTQN